MKIMNCLIIGFIFFNFIDLRRQTCYLSSSSGFCTNGMSQTTKRDQCCCSIGVAWGSDCEACPLQGTRKYYTCTHHIYPKLDIYQVPVLNANDETPMYEMPLTFVFGRWGFFWVGEHLFLLRSRVSTTAFCHWHFVPRSA